MGELPHQWVDIHRSCGCGAAVEQCVKFSDGVAVDFRVEPPRHEPGFVDEAGQWD
jgi:hypothetical protein